LDVATRLMVADVIGREATFTEYHRLAGPDRAAAVAKLGVDVLVCGAVSRELEERLVANGIEVIAEVRGDAREVIRAKLDGALSQPCFMLPGCHTRRRRGGSRHPQRPVAGSS
jgi:predicted Fe-Mo cluster-binding NifX family protein